MAVFMVTIQFVLSSTVTVLFVVLSMEINRRHYFWSNLCSYAIYIYVYIHTHIDVLFLFPNS